MSGAGLGDQPITPAGAGLQEADPAMTMADLNAFVRNQVLMTGRPREDILREIGVDLQDFTPMADSTPPEESARMPTADDPASRLSLLPGAFRRAGESFARGVGADGLAETVAPTDLQEAREQSRAAMREGSPDLFNLPEDATSGEKMEAITSFVGETADIATQAVPDLVAPVAGGIAGKLVGQLAKRLPVVGRAIRAHPDLFDRVFTYGAALATSAAIIHGDGIQRLEDQGEDLSDPEVRERLNYRTAIGMAFETIVPVRILRRLFGDQQAADTVRRAMTRGALAGAPAEGLTEVADFVIEESFLNPEIYQMLTSEERTAILPELLDRYPREIVQSLITGAGLGAAGEGGSAALEQRASNARLQAETEALAGTLEPLGVDLAQVEDMARTRAGAQTIRDAAERMGLANRARAAEERAISLMQDDEQRKLATEDMNARYSKAVDRVAKAFGAPKTQADVRREEEERERLRFERASERARSAGLKPREGVGAATLETTTSRLDEAAARVETLKDRLEATANPERRAETQAELDAALDEQFQARVDALEKVEGRTSQQAIEAVRREMKQSEAERRRAAQREARERAIERQAEIEFPETMAPEARAARAREILADAEGQQDRGLENKIKRLQRQRRAATDPQDIDRLTNEIADLEARRGLPTPAVEAARRVLQDQGEEVSGVAEAQGPGNQRSVGEQAPAGGEAAATATPETGEGEPAGRPSRAALDRAREGLDSTLTDPARMRERFPALDEDVAEYIQSRADEAADGDVSRVDAAAEISQFEQDVAAGRIADGTRFRALEGVGGFGRLLYESVRRDVAMAATVPRRLKKYVDRKLLGRDLYYKDTDVGHEVLGKPARSILKELGSPKNRDELEIAMRDWSRRTGFEICANVDADGNVLDVVTNDSRDFVGSPFAGGDDPTTTNIHTHPYDIGPSAPDICCMLSDGLGMRIVLPNAGVIHYESDYILDSNDEFAFVRELFDNAISATKAEFGNSFTMDGAVSIYNIASEAAMNVLEDIGLVNILQPNPALTMGEQISAEKIFESLKGQPAAVSLRALVDLAEGAAEVEGGRTSGSSGEGLGQSDGDARAVRRSPGHDGSIDLDDDGLGADEFLADLGLEPDSGPVDLDVDSADALAGQQGIGRSSQRPKKPSVDPAKVSELADAVVAELQKSKMGAKPLLKRLFETGEITPDMIRRGITAWLEADGMKEMHALYSVYRRMFPALTEADTVQRMENRKDRVGGTGLYWSTTDEVQHRMTAIMQLRSAVNALGHGTFERRANRFTAKGRLESETYFSDVNAELRDFVDFQQAPGLRLDPPLTDPNDTSLIKRNPSRNRLSEDGLAAAERTARTLQANVYKVDEGKLAALSTDDLVSKKVLAKNGMRDKRAFLDRWDEIQTRMGDTPVREWSREDRDFRYQYGNKINELRASADRRLRQLRMAYEGLKRDHGPNPDVGFMYQIDDRGRIYADGSFHPQADSAIKGIFTHNGRNLVDDMVTVDASASGWQVNALMARDDVGARNLNMGRGQATEPGYSKFDIYTETLKSMRRRLVADAEADTSQISNVRDRRAAEMRKRVARVFLDRAMPGEDKNTWFIDRNGIKPAVIAMNYGGDLPTFRRTLVDVLGQRVRDHLPPKKDMDAAGVAPWSYVAGLAMDGVSDVAPHSMALQRWAIQSLRQLVAAIDAKYGKDADPLEFTINIDGKNRVKKRKQRQTSSRISYEGTDITTNFKVDLDALNPERTANAIWANIVQSYDSAILHRSVERYRRATNGDFITTNHDSFTVPPEREGEIASAVRESMRVIMSNVDMPQMLFDEIQAHARAYGVEVDVQPFDNMGRYNFRDLDTSTPVFGESGNVDDRPDDFVPNYAPLPAAGSRLRRSPEIPGELRPGQPEPLYVQRPVTDEAPIREWAEANGIPIQIDDPMHVTVAASRDPVDIGNAPAAQATLSGPINGRLAILGDSLVLELAPDEDGLRQVLADDHARYREAGASWDFPSYRPHITLHNDAASLGLDLDAIPPFTGAISLGPEQQTRFDFERVDGPDPGGDDPGAGGGRPTPLVEPGSTPPANRSAVRRAPRILPPRIDVADYMEQIEGGNKVAQAVQEFARDPGPVTDRQIKALDRNILNIFQPIRSLEKQVRGDGTLGVGMESAFKAAEIAINDSGRNEALLYYGAGAFDDRMAFVPAEGTVGLLDIFRTASGGRKDGQKLQHWFEYMAALRAEQDRAMGIENPLTDTDIAAAKARENDDFRAAREMWQKHNRANLKMLRESGRITQEQFNALVKDEFYIPFYRTDQRVDGTAPDLELPQFVRTAGGELRARDPGIKARKGGSKMRIANMAENMIRNSQAIVAASMRNVAANKVFDLMEAAGLVDYAPASQTKPHKDAIKRWTNGKEEWVIPRDDDAILVMGALGGLAPIEIDGILRVFNGISSIFRAGMTSRPSFMLNNLWRGMISNGILTQGANLTPSSNTLTGIGRAAGLLDSTAYREFKFLSGMGDFRLGQAQTGFGQNDLLVDIGLDRPSLGYAGRKVYKAWEGAGMVTEMADRVAAYETMVARGVPRDEAAYQALTVMNYNRRGGNPTIRKWLSTMPFLNARLQGYARLAEGTIGKNATPETRRLALKRMLLTGLVYTAANAAAWLWNYSDEDRREEYQALPTWRRVMFMNIVMPSGFVLTLPQPFELGFVFGALPTAAMDEFAADLFGVAEDFALTSDADDVASLEGALPQVFAKIVADVFAFSALPQAVGPLLEGQANVDLFFGRPIETQVEQNLDPDLRTQNADEFAKFIGARLGVSNLTGVSPAMISHYGSNYAGVPYIFMAGMMNAFASDLGLAPPQAANIFGQSGASRLAQSALKGFVFDPSMSPTRYTEEFYRIGQEATQAVRSFRTTMDPDRLGNNPAGAVGAYTMFNRSNSTLRDLRRAEEAIRESETMTPEEKRARLSEITRAKNLLVRMASEGMSDMLDR